MKQKLFKAVFVVFIATVLTFGVGMMAFNLLAWLVMLEMINKELYAVTPSIILAAALIAVLFAGTNKVIDFLVPAKVTNETEG